MICRIQTRVPIPLEKHDVIPQMGRFTLRDEGKTIALGKVLKYKPVNTNIFANLAALAQQQEKNLGSNNQGSNQGSNNNQDSKEEQKTKQVDA